MLKIRYATCGRAHLKGYNSTGGRPQDYNRTQLVTFGLGATQWQIIDCTIATKYTLLMKLEAAEEALKN